MEIDRDLLLQLVEAIESQIHASHAELQENIGELSDKMDLLEIVSFSDSEGNPLLQVIKESFGEIRRNAAERRRSASARYKEAARRAEQMKMLIEGRSLNEIDRHFQERDKRLNERRLEWSRAFDQTGR